MSHSHSADSRTEPPVRIEFEAPDLTGFLGGHSVMRAQFALLARAAGEVNEADTKRLAALERHLAFVTRRLVQHHTAEDDSIWPQLRQRRRFPRRRGRRSRTGPQPARASAPRDQ